MSRIDWTGIVQTQLNISDTRVWFSPRATEKVISKLEEMSEALHEFNFARDMKTYPDLLHFYHEWNGAPLGMPPVESCQDVVDALTEETELDMLDEFEVFAVHGRWDDHIVVFAPYIGYIGADNAVRHIELDWDEHGALVYTGQ